MKLRLSYTILNLWQRGLRDKAIETIFKLEEEPSQAIFEGKAIDELLNEKIIKEKKLPSFFSDLPLKNPIPQLKLETDYGMFTIVGVLDCYDEGTIYEFKTGKIPSNVYAQGNQIAVYTFLATRNLYPVERIYVFRYDQSSDKSDATMVWFSQSLIERAEEFIIRNGNELYRYLEENNLLDSAIEFQKFSQSIALDKKDNLCYNDSELGTPSPECKSSGGVKEKREVRS